MRPDQSFQDRRVSHAWSVVLPVAAERVTFRVNSGRRTEAEQNRLVREKGVWSPSNPTGAAAYSPVAPHIRDGREDHALDVDTNVGDGERELQRELARLGLPTRNPIAAEPWHLEATSERVLLAVAEHLEQRRAIDILGPRTRAWAVEYIRLRDAGLKLPRRRALLRRLVARRRTEWVASRRGAKAGRAAAARRYDVLRRVTS